MSWRSDRVAVWADGWQMACCGTPFAIGDSVSSSIRTDVDRAFLSLATSAETAARIGYREEHHDDPDEADLDSALEAVGVVRALWAASCL